MRGIARLALFSVMALGASAPAFAQATTGMENKQVVLWGTIGFQGDVGGSVNSSGLGIVGGLPGEINLNTWGERYDSSLIVRAGGGYNLTAFDMITVQTHWEQAEADRAKIGLLGGQDLYGTFSDQQGWGIDFGYRRTFATTTAIKPFFAGSFGTQRTQEIVASFEALALGAVIANVPFYDDSWVSTWRIGGGFLWDFHPMVGLQVSLDFKYSGVMSDAAGLGQVGFERINDTGNRWTTPLLGGFYVKF